MKRLQDYIIEHVVNIFEATMSGQWNHIHNNDINFYPRAVIQTLIKDKKVKLGKNAEIESNEISDEAVNKLKQIDITDKNAQNEFNNIVKEFGFKWSDISKGPYSGYINGLSSKNKGNAFEDDFIKNFTNNEEYQNKLFKIISNNPKKIILCDTPKAMGAENTKRPLTLINGQLYAFPKEGKKYSKSDKFNIGKAVTDVTITIQNKDKLNSQEDICLSLKYGDKVTFINAGINNKDVFPHSAFINNDIKEFGKIGNEILNIFNIDAQLFLNVFNNYNVNKERKIKSNKLNVDITKDINKDKFFEFAKSVIGYGFILVHLVKSKVYYLDLRSEDDLNKFIGNTIKSAVIKYPNDGNAKRIDIEVNLSNINFTFNIRPKNGGIYPTHFMADYKIIH